MTTPDDLAQLREYIDLRVDGLRELLTQKIHDNAEATKEATLASKESVAAAFAASEKAIVKSELASEKRFESVNEFRGQLSDQAATFLPREIGDSQMNELRKQLSGLTQRMDQSAGRSAGATATIGYLLAAATLIISLVILYANKQI